MSLFLSLWKAIVLSFIFLSPKKARITIDIVIVERAITIEREINKRSKVLLAKMKQRRLISISLQGAIKEFVCLLG